MLALKMTKRKTKQEPTVSEQDLIDDLEDLMLEFDELVKQESDEKAKTDNAGWPYPTDRP